MIGPQLGAWTKDQRSLRLRRIKLASWGDDAARQHEIHQLPHLRLYRGSKEMSRDHKEITQMLNQTARPPR